MDAGGHYLVVAMAQRRINVYDTRKLDQPMQRRESSLKHQTRCVRVFKPDPVGFVSSSIEGRVAVEFFDASEQGQSKKYAFKCHRESVVELDGSKSEIVYPVNALAFHPVHGTFVTGGSDGVVSSWDAQLKKRMRNYPKLPAGISALAFSCDGSRLAVASSYTFDEGEKEYVYLVFEILIL